MKNIHLQLRNLIGQIESAMIQASIGILCLCFLHHCGIIIGTIAIACISGVSITPLLQQRYSSQHRKQAALVQQDSRVMMGGAGHVN